MSKLSFRARALDATKPLPIYHAVDLPDISEYNTINRTVPQMPTGMEKEEETERHLQEVIIAQQTNRANKNVIIPTPENAIVVLDYEELAPKMGKPLPFNIRVPGLPLEEDVPDYDLDSEDEEWLSRQTVDKPLSSLQFERMMDKLEKGSGNVVLSEREAQALLKDDEDLVLAVYEYWLSKRLKLSGPLLPTVKQERRDGTACGSNPYIAFRKRTEKMQTRKNRKNDETAYMQMQKLKRDLDKAFSLTALIKDRENKKYDLAQVQMDIFQKRYMLQDWSGSLMASLCPVATRSASSRQNSNVNEYNWDGNSILKVEADEDYDIHQMGRHEVLVSGVNRKKKRKKANTANLTESPLPDMPATPERATTDPLRVSELGVDKMPDEDDIDSKYAFKRKPYVKYHMARDSICTWPWIDDRIGVDGEEGEEEGVEFGCITTRERPPRSKKLRFSKLTLSGDYVGLCRRRVGRGGRVVFDRVPLSDMDDNTNTLPDLEPMDTSTNAVATPLPPVGSASSSLDNSLGINPLVPSTPSPVTASLAANLPGAVTTTSPGAEAVQTSPLARASSVQGGGVSSESTARDAVKSGISNKKKTFKSRHYICRTPSPSSKVDIPPLDLIVPQPHPFPDASPYSPDGLDFRTPDVYTNSDFSVLRRLPSFSDYREDMTTFSSLPTSHFTLKPSSSDTEMDESPMSYWNQSGSGDRYSDSGSGSWSWNHPFTGLGNDKHWHRPPLGGSNGAGRVSSSSFHSSLNYSAVPGHNYRPGMAQRQKSNQQVQGGSGGGDVQNSGNGTVKDVSRSSLSVTDSKTIVLTNTPASSHHNTAGGDKKKGENKGIQNHRVVGVGGNGVHKKWSSLATERPSKKPLQDGTNPVVDSRLVGLVGGGGGNSGGIARTRSVDELKSVAAAAVAASSGGGSSIPVAGGQVNGGGGGSEGALSKISKSSEKLPSSTPGNSTVRESPSLDAKGLSSAGISRARSVSDRNSAPPAPVNVNKPAESNKPSSSTVIKRVPAKEPVDVDIWTVNGPGNRILSLNTAVLKDKVHPKRLKKKPISAAAAQESAKALTSKFGLKLPSKRSDASGMTSSSMSDLTMALSSQSPANLLLHSSSSANSRSGSCTPTILDGVLAHQKLGALGTAIAAGLSGVKVTELPSAAKSSAEIAGNVVASNAMSSSSSSGSMAGVGGGGGADVKRSISTNSVSSDGIVGHVTSQVDHVTASVGTTNGTNFQEMYNSSKRKLSESTERGLKQALAGFMKHKLVNVKIPDCKVE